MNYHFGVATWDNFAKFQEVSPATLPQTGRLELKSSSKIMMV
jgi:hypothetical protein